MSVRGTRRRAKKVAYPPQLLSRWKLEAKIYSSISTLNVLVETFERGDLDPSIYQKQLRTLLTESIQARLELEKVQFDLDAFIKEEGLKEQFPLGIDRIQMVDGAGDQAEQVESLVQMDYGELKKLPEKSAAFVSAAIELTDILRLESIATVDRILPLLDEIHSVLSSTPNLGPDWWGTKEATEWIIFLNKKTTGTLLREEMSKKLELQTVRWLNDFRRELKSL